MIYRMNKTSTEPWGTFKGSTVGGPWSKAFIALVRGGLDPPALTMPAHPRLSGLRASGL